MREPLGGGHRPPPKSRHGVGASSGGAGGGPSSGVLEPLSRDLRFKRSQSEVPGDVFADRRSCPPVDGGDGTCRVQISGVGARPSGDLESDRMYANIPISMDSASKSEVLLTAKGLDVLMEEGENRGATMHVFSADLVEPTQPLFAEHVQIVGDGVGAASMVEGNMTIANDDLGHSLCSLPNTSLPLPMIFGSSLHSTAAAVSSVPGVHLTCPQGDCSNAISFEAASSCMRGEGMDVEGRMNGNSCGSHVSGKCSYNNAVTLNGVGNADCMSQGNALGSHGLHGELLAEVCMGSGNMQGDEIVLDAGGASGDVHGGWSAAVVKAVKCSSSVSISEVAPHLICEKDNVHIFSAKRSTCNEAILHDSSATGHSFKMGSKSCIYTGQNLVSSKLSGACTPGEYVTAQEKIKLQNSIPSGYMNSSHATALKLKDLGNGGVANQSRSTNAHHSSNVWSRPPVVSLPKLYNSGSFLIDENTVRLDEEAMHANYKQFEGALIGRLFGKPLAFFHLNAELKRRWEHFGSFRLVMTNASRFICFFDCVEARDSVMMGGPWVIAGQVLSINSWSASFNSSPKDELITPIWVRLPGLPLHCWDSQNLTRITTPIGEPLWIDSATALLERGSFARVCVKMDLSKPVKAGIWVHISQGKFYQPVEYEGLPILCFRCGLVGHKVAGCKMGSKESWAEKVRPNIVHAGKSATALDESVGGTVKEKVGVPSSEPTEVKTLSICKDPDLDKGLGPWTVVSRRRRPSQNNQGSKFWPSHKGGMTFKTNKLESVDKKQHSSPLPSSFGSVEGLIKTAAPSRFCNLHDATVGGKLNKSFYRALPPSSSNKELDKKASGSCQHQGDVWIENNKDTRVLQVQDNASSMVLHVDAKPSVTLMDASQHEEPRVVDKNPPVHGLDEALPSHGVLVPYNSQNAFDKTAWEGGKRKGVNSLKVERMLNDLGPISLSPRKQRMIIVKPDGGDASPLPTS